MITIAARISTILLGLTTAVLPVIYLPDILPPIFGYPIFPKVFEPIFDFLLLPRLFFLQSILLIILLGWGLAIFKKPPVLLPSSPIFLPFLIYLGISLLSNFWSTNQVEGLIQTSKIFTFFLLTILAAFALTPAAIRKVCTIWISTGAIISFIGITQYFGWSIFDIPTAGNPSSTFGYRNFAASYLVVTIPVSAGIAWTSKNRWVQTTLFFTTVLMILFLIYTRTRGAWVGIGIAFLIGTSILLLLRIRYSHHPKGFNRFQCQMVFLCLLFLIIGSSLSDKMKNKGKFQFDEHKSDIAITLKNTFSPTESRGRLTVWRHTLEMVGNYPFLGVGLGSWQFIYPRYDKGESITDNTAPQRPHNDFLWILSETGIFGLGAYIWLFITLGKTIWSSIRKRLNDPEILLVFSISLGILALIGHSFFSFPRERIAPSTMFWMSLGFVMRLSRENTSRISSIKLNRLVSRVALGFTITLLACSLFLTHNQMQFDYHYLKAVKAWKQNRWSNVLSQADLALSWGPFNYRILLLKGLANQKLGNSQAAVQAYTASLRYHPNEGHLPLGDACASLGHYVKASDHYQAELQLFPKSSKATLRLARLYYDQKKYSQAEPLYRKSMKFLENQGPTHPDFSISLNNLAHIYEHLNQWEEASKIYKKLLKIFSNSADLFTKLGRALQKQGNFYNAFEAYRQAIQITPKDPKTYNNLGTLFRQQGRLHEAEKAYLEAIQFNPNYAHAYHNLGDLYADKKNIHRAIKAYESFLQTWKGNQRFLRLVQEKIQNLKGML